MFMSMAWRRRDREVRWIVLKHLEVTPTDTDALVSVASFRILAV